MTYRERDLAAALRIMRRDGIKVGRVHIGKDGVDIVPAGDDAAQAEEDEAEAARERMTKIIRDL